MQSRLVVIDGGYINRHCAFEGNKWYIFAIFYKEDNFCDFLFAFLHTKPVLQMQKLLTFFSKSISIYALFNDQSFNDTLTNDIVCFEQLGSGE